VASAIVIARDITEQRRTEEMKDNLLRDVSHELRTPLARAQISLELLLERVERDPIDREDAVKYGRMALDNARWLAQTLEVILDLSRLEAGVGAFQRETIQVAGLIAAGIADMEPLAADKGLTLVADVAEHLPPILGDREKLSRVLRNLIDNAIKFASRGKIVISVAWKPPEIEVSVRDEGCGILPENLERVFDRFFQESAEYPGVGVGLPMCKTIVEAHNGRIWAESDGKGRGATLRFTLPALKDVGESPGDPEKEEDHEQ
jgi:signal transduction histidine kinase